MSDLFGNHFVGFPHEAAHMLILIPKFEKWVVEGAF